jgi:two-component system, chemotaxis family, protein-glutamate methylesterase/glutaminase
MSVRKIIVIGASAGGVEALIELVKSLPEEFDTPIFVVQHTSPYSKSNLPNVLSRHTNLKVDHPKDGEKVKGGHIYLAPPDHHLLLDEDHIMVKKGPKENRFRPSIDALFRSAAYLYRENVIGIILSGLLNDGTSGLWSIKRFGGTSIIQDPQDALFSDMPENTLEFVDVDHIVPVSKMAPLLESLLGSKPKTPPAVTAREMELLKTEVVIAKRDNAFEMGIMNMGQLSPFTCPECHGALVKFTEGKAVRFRCHTGHAFTASALLAGITTSIEESLWNAIRALEETAMLLETIGNTYKEVGNKEAASEFLDKAGETRERARRLHETVFSQEIMSEDLRHHKENGTK